MYEYDDGLGFVNWTHVRTCLTYSLTHSLVTCHATQWLHFPLLCFQSVADALQCVSRQVHVIIRGIYTDQGWLVIRVVSVLDSGAEGTGFKSQSRRCRITVFGKLFTPIVALFTKQQNWQQPS